MHRLQELVRLHRVGRGAREVARLLHMSPNTERDYRRRLRAAGLLGGDPEDLPALEVLQAAVKREPPRKPAQEQSSIERWRPLIEDKLAKGAGPTAIHQVLGEERDDFEGSLSAVKRMCRQIRRARGPRVEDVVIPVQTPAGQVAQVDFGYIGKLRDPATGKLRKAWVFVLVLGYSRHLFAKVVFDQHIETWLTLHREAFEALGGVPEMLVPDNLKAAVVRAAFSADEATALNRSYRELARHYGFVIDPAPPYSPEKKGKVESAVKYVKGSFFAAREFADIADCNARLARWVHEVAGARTHGTTRRVPLEVFEAEEKSMLQPLPARPFEAVVWHEGTVGRNAHVTFEGRFFSVPWSHIGARVWLRATGQSVVVFRDGTRLATHRRYGDSPYETHEAHLPEGRRDLRHRSRSYWEARADALGEEVGAYIREVFDADAVSYPLRAVAAMLRRLEQVPVERARAACVRASYFANFKVAGLKAILAKGLDQQPLPGHCVSPQWASNPRFARAATEFLQALEVSDEPS